MRSIFGFLLAVASLCARQMQVKLDTKLTKVNFTLGDVLHTVHGSFQLTKGELWFVPESGKAGGLLIVAGASGNSGSHARDSRMNKNVLESETYPDITFTPDRIEGKVSSHGHSEFKLHGTFWIHGGTHALTMDIKANINGTRLIALANFEVPYVQWGLKSPSTLFLRVNDTVPIEINAIGTITSLK